MLTSRGGQACVVVVLATGACWCYCRCLYLCGNSSRVCCSRCRCRCCGRGSACYMPETGGPHNHENGPVHGMGKAPSRVGNVAKASQLVEFLFRYFTASSLEKALLQQKARKTSRKRAWRKYQRFESRQRSKHGSFAGRIAGSPNDLVFLKQMKPPNEMQKINTLCQKK